MTSSPRSRNNLLVLLASGSLACSGLMASPESNTVTPIPAPRDSAYARARRALQTESFTMDVVDSAGGLLTGTRWPSATAQQGTSAACHVTVALRIRGDESRSEVTSSSRWVAPKSMGDKAPEVCEEERTQVLDRTVQTLAPASTP